MRPTYSVQRQNRTSKIAMSIAVLVLITLALAPYWADRAGLRLLVEIFYYLALAQMWSLLAGYGGLVSVGQQAFVGLGGYMLFSMAGFGGVPPLWAVLLSGVLAAVIAIPTGLIAFRLKGAYFAIGTWVIAEVFQLSFAQFSSLGGGSGMSLPAQVVTSIAESREGREFAVYWVALAIALGALLLVFVLLRSRWGLAMTAIRDNETASESLGVETYRTKFLVYIAAAAVTGMVGALIFLQKLRISPDAAFSLNDWTALVIFIVVIGGIGTLEGPILGVAIFFILREFAADWGTWYLIILGGIAVIVMLFAPKGLWGLISRRHDIQLFPVERRLIINSEKED